MTIAIILHVIGTVLGVGGVTVNDVMLLRSVGDGDLGVAYQKSAKWYSVIIWFGWLLIAGSAIYFALTNSWVMHSSKMLFKILIMTLMTVNGLLMNVVLTPSIEALKREDWNSKSVALKKVMLNGVFPGALSISAWYMLLILGAAGKQPWTAGQMSFWYLVILLGAWAGAYLVVRWRLNAK